MTLTRPRYSPGGWTDAPIHPTHRRSPGMTTPTPSIPGVDRDDLADVIRDYISRARLGLLGTTPRGFADVAIAHIAALHECACDREHADEWVEVDRSTWDDMPKGARLRSDWVRGAPGDRYFVHRDDLPDPDADLVERMAKAIFAAEVVSFGWDTERDQVRDKYRALARAALAAYREGDR